MCRDHSLVRCKEEKESQWCAYLSEVAVILSGVAQLHGVDPVLPQLLLDEVLVLVSGHLLNHATQHQVPEVRVRVPAACKKSSKQTEVHCTKMVTLQQLASCPGSAAHQFSLSSEQCFFCLHSMLQLVICRMHHLLAVSSLWLGIFQICSAFCGCLMA